MDKLTFTSKTQASRTLFLLAFTYLICLQLSRTFHCIVISNIHVTVTTTVFKLTLSNLYLLPCCKTRNSNENMCYSISNNVYGSVKLTIVLLDPTKNYNQLGSETRTSSSRSRRTDASRTQQEISAIGHSSSEKLRCKGGKPGMASAIEALSDHTHINTKDENGHPQKSDKRSKQKKGRTMRPAQETARRKLQVQLRVRLERAEVWRLNNSHAVRVKTVQITYTENKEIGSIKREDQREKDPKMWNQHIKPRPWNGKSSKGVPILEQDNLQPNRINPGKLSNSFSCKNLSIHMSNLPLFNNKHINKKIQNRVSHCGNVQLTRQKRERKASLAKQWVWKIIELKTCRQWSRRVTALNQHKTRRPKISRKLKIRNNQPHDFNQGTASHAMLPHDPHTAAHDLATENHEEHERPKKSTKASHARCTTTKRRKTIDNIKSGHLITNVSEVLVELWRSRRGRLWT